MSDCGFFLAVNEPRECLQPSSTAPQELEFALSDSIAYFAIHKYVIADGEQQYGKTCSK